MATYEHGSWDVSGTTSLREYVAMSLGDYANEYLLSDVIMEYYRAVNRALPDEAQLCGDTLYGTVQEKRYNLTEIAEAIDLYEIASRHALVGTWKAMDGDIETLSIRQYVDSCLTGRRESYDLETLISDLEEEIDNLLSSYKYNLCNDKIFGPEGTKPPNLDDIIKMIDFEALAERSEYSTY